MYGKQICDKCGKEKNLVKLNIVDCKCWNCGKPMKMAIGLTGGTFWGPEEFDQGLIDIARSNSVILEERFSKTVSEIYLANVCPHCNQIIGKFFVHDYLYSDDSIYIDAGFKCFSCDE
jgi:hypothetical protein